MNHVFRIKPSTIKELKPIEVTIEDFSANIDPDLVSKACASAKLRFEKMRREKGGHSEYLFVINFFAVWTNFLETM